MNDIKIQTFNRDFQKEARKLVLQGLGEHWGWINEHTNPDLDDIESSFKDGYFITACKADQLVGTGGIKIECKGVYRIERMSVRKDVRRSGIGTQILDELIRWARNKRAQKVVLETTSSWKSAIQFYLKFGFSIICQNPDSTHFDLSL